MMYVFKSGSRSSKRFRTHPSQDPFFRDMHASTKHHSSSSSSSKIRSGSDKNLQLSQRYSDLRFHARKLFFIIKMRESKSEENNVSSNNNIVQDEKRRNLIAFFLLGLLNNCTSRRDVSVNAT